MCKRSNYWLRAFKLSAFKRRLLLLITHIQSIFVYGLENWPTQLIRQYFTPPNFSHVRYVTMMSYIA